MHNFDLSSLELHKRNKGKISVVSKVNVVTKEDLSNVYTPGVASPCREIVKNPNEVYAYTSKSNMVAVISDGSAVLGLGNIGPEASLPVMEGKCILFKQFGEIDAFPIVLNCNNSKEIINTIKNIAPSFGGINLEDISSPRCFEIERELEENLDIPVFHDDQHGTAIVVAAGLINACKLTKRKLESVKVVLNGPGAAGTAIIKMLINIGVRNIIACDENGILSKDKSYKDEPHKKELISITNKNNVIGNLKNAIKGVDVFIGVSKANILTPAMIGSMASKPIVFAMANPNPEIDYCKGIESGVEIMATGRSDYPNQINNLLAFPGVFKGALSVRARNINYEMKTAAAFAIASYIKDEDLRNDYIVPSVFAKDVADIVSKAVAKAAIKTGVNKN